MTNGAARALGGPQAGAGHPRLSSALVILTLAALWVLTHPYGGIRHDAILYAAQALLHLEREVFGGDIFFAWGSQDDYTVFGRAYAWAVSGLGLKAASRGLWVVSQALWFAVALAWLRRMVPPFAVPAAGALVFALPAHYGSELVFRVAEPFLTARSFAEPLVLGALLAWMGGRHILAAATLGLAMAIHPIMALPGIVVVALLAASHGRLSRWLAANRAAAFGALATLGAAAVAVLAAAGGFTRIDEQWYGLVAARSALVTVDLWAPGDWARVMLPCGILLLAARDPGLPLRRLMLAIAACGFLGLAFALVACLARWELGVQAQLWRLVWPAVWAAPIAAIAAAVRAPASRAAGRLSFVVAALAVMLAAQEWWAGGWMLAVASFLLLAGFELARVPEGVSGWRIAVSLAVLVCVVALVDAVFTLWVHVALEHGPPVLETTFLATLVEKLGWFVLPLAVLVFGRLAAHPRGGAIAAVGVLACVAAAVVSFDARGPMRVALERRIDTGIPEWSDVIPVDAAVFWPHRLEHVWFVLHRRSYVSGGQLAGRIFSRDKTFEGYRRERSVEALVAGEKIQPRRFGASRPEPAPPTKAELERACRDPALGFVVLSTALGRTVGPAFDDLVSGRRYHLHRCDDFR